MLIFFWTLGDVKLLVLFLILPGCALDLKLDTCCGLKACDRFL